jgi:hypothetical protein
MVSMVELQVWDCETVMDESRLCSDGSAIIDSLKEDRSQKAGDKGSLIEA